MKPQDIVFIIASIALSFACWKRPAWLVGVGILCFILSIPLFSFWIFFTAQRLVYYAAGFIFLGIIFLLIQQRNEK